MSRIINRQQNINNNTALRSEKNLGFSLIEVLVAMVILALMTMPMLATFSSSARINANARRTEDANIIGQRAMERCKALTVEELFSGETKLRAATDAADTASAGGNPASALPVSVNDTGVGVFSAKARKLTTGQYAYTMEMYDGNTATDALGSTVGVCRGTNGLDYYVQTIISPNEGDNSGDGSGSMWSANNYSMPAMADIKDASRNYVIMDEIYHYDTSVKSILNTRAWPVQIAPSSTNAAGVVVANEITSMSRETNLDKMSDIKKIVVLDVELEYQTGYKWTVKPVLYVKYYREQGYDTATREAAKDRPTQYTVESNGDIKDSSGNIISSTEGEVFIKKTTLQEQKDVDLSKGDSFKNIYIFYSSYDREYRSQNSGQDYGSDMDMPDQVYINITKNGGSNVVRPSGEEVKLNVFMVEQDSSAYQSTSLVELNDDEVYINGIAVNGQSKLSGSHVNVFANIRDWSSVGAGTEKNNITHNYSEDMAKRYLYTVTVNIWIGENGKIPDITSNAPFLTLTSTKENDRS